MTRYLIIFYTIWYILKNSDLNESKNTCMEILY